MIISISSSSLYKLQKYKVNIDPMDEHVYKINICFFYVSDFHFKLQVYKIAKGSKQKPKIGIMGGLTCVQLLRKIVGPIVIYLKKNCNLINASLEKLLLLLIFSFLRQVISLDEDGKGRKFF